MRSIMKIKRLGDLSRGAMLKASTWLRQEKGSLNAIYALALIPMIGALGLATDTARGYLLKARLSQSIDQAVLAGGKVYFSPTRDADVLKYFSANFPHTVTISYDTPFDADFMDARVKLNSPVTGGVAASSTLRLSATATIPTTFMRVLNAVGCTSCNEMTVYAEAEVERTIRAVDVVISLDMSGSMDGAAKIGNAKAGLKDFLNTLYGTGVNTSPTLKVDGTEYNLINVGFVPWNSKTNVKTQGATSTTVTTQSVASYTNPVTLATGQTTVWKSGLSEVPLLRDPRNTSAGGQLPGGWSGCVYARYVGGEATPGTQNTNTNSINNNDADLVRGAQFDVGSGSTQKDWPAWEPMAILEGEPQENNWSTADAGSGTRWATDNNWRPRSCTLAYYTDYRTSSNSYTADELNNMDAVNGAIQPGTQATSTNGPTSPALAAGQTSRPVWVPAITAATGTSYSGTMRFFNDNTRPAAVPPIGDNPAQNDCSPCLTRSIFPLSPNRGLLSAQIDSITNTDPDGNTNILQGMYWAWEVLMPGEPFNQAYVTTPYQRDRYIILITDGAQVGGNGDAYKGRFGSGEIAGDNTDSAHGTISAPVESGSWKYGDPIPAFVTTNNNLDNRLRVLSRNVKNEGIKLYVIGFDLADHPNELRMLAALASPPDGDSPQYFFAAESGEDLKNALKTIVQRLTDVRLSM